MPPFSFALCVTFIALIFDSPTPITAATDTRTVKDFVSMDAAGPFLITLQITNKTSFKLDGDAQTIKAVNTSMNRWGALKIRLTGPIALTYKGPPIKITATTPTPIVNFILGGSAKVTVAKRLKTDSLNVVANENSSLTVDVDATTVHAVLSGNSVLKMDFHAYVLQAVLYGTSRFNASGSADVETVEISQDAAFYGKKLRGGIVTGSIRGQGRGEFNSKQQIQVAVYDQGVATTSGMGVATKDAYGRAKIN